MILYLLQYKDGVFHLADKTSFVINTESFDDDVTYYLVSIKKDFKTEHSYTLQEVRKLLDDNV